MSVDRFRKVLQDGLIKKIIKNTGIIIFGNTTASALNFISFTILARQLGPSSLAVLVLAQTYALIVNDIFNIQTWESMIKFGSEQKDDRHVTNIIKTNLLMDLGSAAFAFLCALALISPTAAFLGWDASHLNIFMLYSFSILFNITTLTIGIPRLFDKFMSVARVHVVLSIIKLILVVCSMFFADELIVYVCIYLGVDVLINITLIIYSFILLKRRYGPRWWKQRCRVDSTQLRFIWWTNLRTIIRIPVRHFDMIVISSVMSLQMVGIYKVYKEIAGLINRIGDPVNQAIFPEFTKLLGSRDIRKTSSVTKRTMLLLGGLGIVFSLCLLAMSNYIIGQFYGEAYLLDIRVLYIMIAMFAISFITVPINSLFIAAGFAKYSFFIICFSNVVYLLVAVGFCQLIGIYGVVLAFACQLIMNKGLKIYFLKKYSDDWGMMVR